VTAGTNSHHQNTNNNDDNEDFWPDWVKKQAATSSKQQQQQDVNQNENSSNHEEDNVDSFFPSWVKQQASKNPASVSHHQIDHRVDQQRGPHDYHSQRRHPLDTGRSTTHTNRSHGHRHRSPPPARHYPPVHSSHSQAPPPPRYYDYDEHYYEEYPPQYYHHSHSYDYDSRSSRSHAPRHRTPPHLMSELPAPSTAAYVDLDSPTVSHHSPQFANTKESPESAITKTPSPYSRSQAPFKPGSQSSTPSPAQSTTNSNPSPTPTETHHANKSVIQSMIDKPINIIGMKRGRALLCADGWVRQKDGTQKPMLHYDYVVEFNKQHNIDKPVTKPQDPRLLATCTL
jgi:hypothetical protein